MPVDSEYDLKIDSECDSFCERARRRALVNTRDCCSPVSGCGPALDPHLRELHDVPMLRAACEDYSYLRWQQRWNVARASWASLKRAGLRLQVLTGVELFRPGVMVLVAMVLVFVAGVLVGARR